MDDIEEIEEIIYATRSSIFDERRTSLYLEAIAKTQLLILKELRKRKECTCQKS